MSKISFTPNVSGTGTINVVAPNTNTNKTLTLPDANGTLATSQGTTEIAAALAIALG